MTKSIVLGGGCFWCIEAVFQRVKGVEGVVSGYAGGSTKNPTYHDHADHAEVVEVTYDHDLISLQQILEIFFSVHNPTTLNRQGNDIGTQYRSMVLYASDEEKSVIDDVLKEVATAWDDPVVTEVKKLDAFYRAEDYHQDYFNQNPGNPYCQAVINPKLAKFRKTFADFVKE